MKKAGEHGGDAAAQNEKAPAAAETPKSKETVSSGNDSQNADADESKDEAADEEKAPAATAAVDKSEAASKGADAKKADSAAPKESGKSKKAVGGMIVIGI